MLAGGAPNRIYKVVARVSIADGGWHAVERQRSDTDLSIVVDQVWRAAIPIPRGLSVANTDHYVSAEKVPIPATTSSTAP